MSGIFLETKNEQILRRETMKKRVWAMTLPGYFSAVKAIDRDHSHPGIQTLLE